MRTILWFGQGKLQAKAIFISFPLKLPPPPITCALYKKWTLAATTATNGKFHAAAAAVLAAVHRSF